MSIGNLAPSDGQRGHMEWLSSLKPEEKCWCGWERVGQCYNCRTTHPGKTAADKLAERKRAEGGRDGE